jgi:hypothetical protein
MQYQVITFRKLDVLQEIKPAKRPYLDFTAPKTPPQRVEMFR